MLTKKKIKDMAMHLAETAWLELDLDADVKYMASYIEDAILNSISEEQYKEVGNE